jgi:hypothetical protein
MSNEEVPEEEEGFFKAPGSDLAAIDKFLNERGMPSPLRSGINALIQGQPAPTVEPSDRRFGTLPWLLRDAVPGALGASGRLGIDTAEDFGRFLVGADALPAPEERLSAYLIPRTGAARPDFTDVIEGDRAAANRLRRRFQDQSRATQETQVVEEPATTDWRAEAERILGGGPDYSAYRASLEDMVLNPESGLSPRLQAMYNQLAEQAGANQQRISDIYGGASENVGSVYDTSAANVGDAFSSSQRQLADSLARLGIEEAAGQVMPQAAGRQASALAALEQGRAGGLSALERYGASSGDFASQMGQAAQQRGVEQNEFLLGALQRQLAESLGMEAQGAYDARLRAPGLARDLFEASQIGQPQSLTPEQEMALDNEAFRRAQAAADIEMQYGQRAGEVYDLLTTEGGMSREEAQAEIQWRRQNGLL